jgi:hypothetical protein
MKKKKLKAHKNKTQIIFNKPRFKLGTVPVRDDSDSEANKNSSGQNNLGSLGKNDGCTGATNNRATITKQLRQKQIVQSSHNSSTNIKKLSLHNSNSMRLNM